MNKTTFVRTGIRGWEAPAADTVPVRTRREASTPKQQTSLRLSRTEFRDRVEAQRDGERKTREEEKEKERATHEDRFRLLVSFTHTITNHYTCTRISSLGRVSRKQVRESEKERDAAAGTRGTAEEKENPRDGGSEEERKEIFAHTREPSVGSCRTLRVSGAAARVQDCTVPLLTSR